MAGGTWVTQNKVRPGVYINFESAPKPLGTLGERGITSMALSLPWGESKSIMRLEAGENMMDKLGFDITTSELLLVREALKRARTLLLYRLNTGAKATVTVGDLTATAKHGGTRGNDLSIVVSTNIDDPAKKDIVTLLDGAAVDTQIVAAIAELTSNAWIDWSGTGTLTESAGAPLAGGDNGSVTNQDHTDYLAALELESFNTLAYTGGAADLKAVYAAYVKRLRDNEGKKVQVVLENYASADHEGVISVKNGVVLEDGTSLTAAEAAAWVAGATASAAVSQSLTYSAYDGAVDASPRYTNSQIEAALLEGEFLFTPGNGTAVVEQDINSLRSFTATKDKAFAKNRVIRVLDSIANDVKLIFESFYIGKVDNNADGRNLLKAEVINYMQTLQGIGAVQNFDSQSDITITAGTETDAVVVDLSVQPVDSIEKLYMRVEVA